MRKKLSSLVAILFLAAALAACSSLPPPKYPPDPNQRIYNWNP
jgi:predicted small lipoprotein YifL